MSTGSLRDLLTQLPNLDGVSISAEVLPDGQLETIGSEYEKAIAARFEKALPRIHTLVFAEKQRPDVELTHKELLRPDPHAEFRILFAPTLVEAAVQIVARRQNCFGQVCDFSEVLRQWHPHLVGRGWLLERVQSFLDEPTSGYLLLIAAAGYGKSALIAELIRSAGQPVAYHFLNRRQGDWDEPPVMLRSLVAQLRMIFAQPIHESEKDGKPRDLLNTVLGRVSRCLDPGQRAILLVDGLDEVFGPDGRFAGVVLPGVLPARLPLGVKVVLTSRPGPHLAWLADPSLCRSISLDAADAQNQADILLYLREENAARALGLDEVFLRQLAEAAEGCFAAAVLYLRERPNLRTELQAWQQNPSRIPHGLVGWLEDQWTRLENPLGPPDEWRRRPPPPVIRALLGLMASAREPLSADHLAALLAALERQGERPIGAPAIDTMSVSQLRPHLDAVLELAEGFFATRAPHAARSEPYRFFHTGFPEFILQQKLNVVQREDCQRVLAEACWAEYRCGAEGMSEYARAHLASHLAAVCRWEDLHAATRDPSLDLLGRWIDRGHSQEGLLCLAGLVDYLHREKRDWKSASELATQVARLHTQRGHFDEAEQLLNDALRRAPFWGGRRARAVAYHELGSLYLYRGYLSQAKRAYRRALRQCKYGLACFQDEASANLVALAVVLMREHSPTGAMRLARRALEMARHANDPGHVVAAHWILAIGLKDAEAYDQAAYHLHVAALVAEVANLPLERASIELVRGWLCYDRAVLDGLPLHEAEEAFERANKQATPLGHVAMRVEALLSLASCRLAVVDTEGAERYMREATGHIGASSLPCDLEAWVKNGLACLLHQQGDMQGAAQAYQQALEFCCRRALHKSESFGVYSIITGDCS